MSNNFDTAFDLLIKDHKKAKSIISKLMDSSSSDKKNRLNLLVELKTELLKHEKIEEEAVYPVLQKKKDTRDLTLEAYQEHHVVDTLLEELQNSELSAEEWKAKLTVLQENLEHHIQEEEGDLFPEASRVLAADKLDRIARDIKNMKAEG